MIDVQSSMDTLYESLGIKFLKQPEFTLTNKYCKLEIKHRFGPLIKAVVDDSGLQVNVSNLIKRKLINLHLNHVNECKYKDLIKFEDITKVLKHIINRYSVLYIKVNLYSNRLEIANDLYGMHIISFNPENFRLINLIDLAKYNRSIINVYIRIRCQLIAKCTFMQTDKTYIPINEDMFRNLVQFVKGNFQRGYKTVISKDFESDEVQVKLIKGREVTESFKQKMQDVLSVSKAY